jgi:hypothetical protein
MSTTGKQKGILRLVEMNRRWIQKARASKRFSAEGAIETFDLQAMLDENQAVFALSSGRCSTQLLAKLLDLNDQCRVLHHGDPKLAPANTYAWESAATQTPQGLRLALLAGRGE